MDAKDIYNKLTSKFASTELEQGVKQKVLSEANRQKKLYLKNRQVTPEVAKSLSIFKGSDEPFDERRRKAILKDKRETELRRQGLTDNMDQ